MLLLDNILGSAIKELRKSKKMTQQELSKLTGLKQNTISNHENGKRQLDEIDIRTYAKALRVSPQTLFNLSKQNSDNILHDIKENKTQIQSIYDKLSDRNKPKLIKYGNELLEGQSEAKERMMLGKLGRAKSGKYMAWINPAYGYNYDKKSQKTTVIPSQAIIIKRIFDEFINGKPIAKIASDLNKEGKYGKTTSWKPNSLRSLLKNRIYYGVIEYKGEIYKGEHAPIISKETYDLAQIERAKRREITVKRTNNPRPFQSKYMLSGHLRCGYCGARITLYVSKARKDGTKLLKYYCVNRKKSCDSGLYLLNDLEDIVMSEIAKFKLDEDYMSRMTKQPKPEIDKEAIENEIADLDNRLNRLNDLYLNNMIDMNKLKKESSNILATKKTPEPA